MSATQEARIKWIEDSRKAATELLEVMTKLNSLSKTWDAGMNQWIIDASGDVAFIPTLPPSSTVIA